MRENETSQDETASPPAPHTGADESGPVRVRSVTRLWALRLGVAAIAATSVASGFVWWRDRPLREARGALERGEADYAMFRVTEFLDRRSRDARALAIRARALVALGRPADALALFDLVGAASADELHAWAQAYLMLEQWSRALPLLRRVRQMDGQNADALYELASCQVRMGLFDEALDAARSYASLPGHEARGQVFLASVYGDRDNFQEAIAAFEKALRYEKDAENLQVTPDEFFLQYGKILLRAGKPRESITPLARSVAARETAEALVELGNAASQLGQPEKAEQAWKRAVEVAPGNRDAREALANLSLQRNDAKAALEWLRPLEKTSLTRSSTAYLWQRTQTILGDTAEAAKWQKLADDLRRRETLMSTVEHTLIMSPRSFWAAVIRAHRFAEAGNWREAESLLGLLIDEAPREPFVVELAQAVANRTELPSLEKLPVKEY